ncbi:MAG TPA: xanthine dehydrogenase family protein molybdopterin-binding subunit [Chloroflexota bacterium]|jgi:carbon-monoxide dehydrogenase large subunit
MYTGQPIRRREDRRLITGQGSYTDDLHLAGALHLSFVRSPYAHARIVSVDTQAARSQPGVEAVLTGADLAGLKPSPLWFQPPAAHIAPVRAMAASEVRFVGEVVAAVLAGSPYTARDAAEAVAVEYEPLEVVGSARAALETDTPLVHQELGTNVAFEARVGSEGVDEGLAEADEVVRLTIRHPRVAALPLESRSIVARYDPYADMLEIVLSTQYVHADRFAFATILGMPETKIRVITRDVGGGFGAKGTVYPEEAVAAYLAWSRRCTVSWFETRSENLRAMYQGRAHEADVALGVRRDGAITALDMNVLSDLGAYVVPIGGGPPNNVLGLACGAYEISRARCSLTAVYTNRAPVGPYRGAGRPEATFNIERAMDAAARAIGMDPAELRRRNFIPSGAFPYTTPTGHVYDSGNYVAALDKALQLVDYDHWRREQARLRAEGRCLGIGICSFVEPSGAMLTEFGEVRVEKSGKVTVLTGSSPHGQGLHTTFAQIVADELAVPMDDVEVLHGDTAAVAMGTGTFGSRSAMLGGSAARLSAQAVKQKMLAVAANLMEARAEDVELADGRFSVAGVPGRALSFAEVAAAAHGGRGLPPGMDYGLEARKSYKAAGQAYPFGTHIAVVEVDPESGDIHFLRYVGVDDAGTILNPLLVEGQVHGGFAQGLGAVLLEEVVYDDSGQLLSGTLMDYAAPRAQHVPTIQLDHTVTPSPTNELGAKGVGEAGTVAAPPAIVNAVLDALAPLGVTDLDIPLTPPKVWAAIQQAQLNLASPQ